jgi:hypothetical protein
MPERDKKNSSRRVRRKFLRSLIVELDCGHEHEIATSFYRLTKVRKSLIRIGVSSVGCFCGENSSVTKILRTERTEGCRVASENAQRVLFR